MRRCESGCRNVQDKNLRASALPPAPVDLISLSRLARGTLTPNSPLPSLPDWERRPWELPPRRSGWRGC